HTRWPRDWSSDVCSSDLGLSVSCIAGVMYLVQQRQLKSDIAPSHRLPLFSLERLEAMQRHGLDAAFPLLSIGLLVGIALMFLTRSEERRVGKEGRSWWAE